MRAPFLVSTTSAKIRVAVKRAERARKARENVFRCMIVIGIEPPGVGGGCIVRTYLNLLHNLSPVQVVPENRCSTLRAPRLCLAPACPCLPHPFNAPP